MNKKIINGFFPWLSADWVFFKGQKEHKGQKQWSLIIRDLWYSQDILGT